jgi:hypothetical protein
MTLPTTAAVTDRHVLNVAGALVAFGLILILAFVTWALVYVQIPQGNENVLTVLIGILSANVGLVVGFFFGSSQTSKRQSETIDTLAQTAKKAGDALPLPAGREPTVKLDPGESATVEATP